MDYVVTLERIKPSMITTARLDDAAFNAAKQAIEEMADTIQDIWPNPVKITMAQGDTRLILVNDETGEYLGFFRYDEKDRILAYDVYVADTIELLLINEIIDKLEYRINVLIRETLRQRIPKPRYYVTLDEVLEAREEVRKAKDAPYKSGIVCLPEGWVLAGTGQYGFGFIVLREDGTWR